MYISREHLEAYSPSREHGICARLEATFRWSYCDFLKDVGIELKMPQLTIATAVVFCHRFYARHSHGLIENDRFIVATACLFLAAKVEETPKPIKEVVRVAYLVQHKSEYDNAVKRIHQKERFEEHREKVLQAERLILHTVGFDFNVEHPYKHILNLARELCKSDEKLEMHHRRATQVAWNFANDSLRTTLCLQFCPRDIAHAAVNLSFNIQQVMRCNPQSAFNARASKDAICNEICNQIIDLYDGTNAS
mmetsp:Transcript_10303/g.47289  ORF Transcript_10303/g.47289 Transcript_10303/m.47289 type:complete len:250 (+) Transcript_10303:214-963(+)